MGIPGVCGVAKNLAYLFLHTPSIPGSPITESGFHFFFRVANYELGHRLASIDIMISM